MPRKAKELSALEVGRLKSAGYHYVGGVAGLALQVSATGARSWILRVKVGGRRREIGLGGFPDTTLAIAKESARTARQKILDGIDPVEDAKAKRSALDASRASSKTFSEAATAFIKMKEHEWSNPKHTQQWRNTLATYAEPVIGSVFVREITHTHLLQILEPIWQSKTETAKRLLGRIENILDWAKVRGYRSGDNPARWKGHFDKLLPAPKKIQTIAHHPALQYVHVGSFMKALQQQGGTGARALEFAILCASRSGEVRGAKWGEFDLANRIWVIPKERMKAKKEHRVPLSDSAIAVLATIPKSTAFVFTNDKGMTLSDMTLTAVIRRMHQLRLTTEKIGWVDANGKVITAHGFRSTFKDWCSECTSYPNEVSEMALAHAVGNATEEAYRRGDLFEKRQRLMKDWGAYCEKIHQPANVVPLKGKKVK